MLAGLISNKGGNYIFEKKNEMRIRLGIILCLYIRKSTLGKSKY